MTTDSTNSHVPPAPGAVLDPGLTRSRAGRVKSFDVAAGLGEVEEPGGAVHPFHCTAIADGSRDIAVGTEVRFVLVAAHGGRLQAGDLTYRP